MSKMLRVSGYELRVASFFLLTHLLNLLTYSTTLSIYKKNAFPLTKES